MEKENFREGRWQKNYEKDKNGIFQITDKWLQLEQWLWPHLTTIDWENDVVIWRYYIYYRIKKVIIFSYVCNLNINLYKKFCFILYHVYKHLLCHILIEDYWIAVKWKSPSISEDFLFIYYSFSALKLFLSFCLFFLFYNILVSCLPASFVQIRPSYYFSPILPSFYRVLPFFLYLLMCSMVLLFPCVVTSLVTFFYNVVKCTCYTYCFFP